jgi:putative peptidoglycan lipid II flippase
LALPTVSVLFGRGQFGPTQVSETARSLVFMAAGVWAVAASQGVVRMFYALGDTRTPVLCSLANLVTFLSVSLSFMREHGHAAIAGANSVASVVQLLLLTALLRRRAGPLGLRELASKVLRFALASLAMALVVRDVAALADFTRGGNDPRNLAVYALAVVLGALVYGAASYLLGVRELSYIAGILRRRTEVRA